MESWVATVVSLVDGDTILVSSDFAGEVKVELTAIDVPELSEPHGAESLHALENLLRDNSVLVHVTNKKGANTVSAFLEILPKGIGGGPSPIPIANLIMIENGDARHDKNDAPSEHLAQLEEYARESMAGVWAEK